MRAPSTRFLVVEDNELDVEKLTRGFRRLDINNEVVHAWDGVEALEVLRGSEQKPPLPGPFVVLLDLNMPRMNGLELLEEIRSDQNLAHTPVVVISTSSRSADVEAAYNCNVSGYLVKTMDMSETYKALGALSSYWETCELPMGTSPA